MAIAQILQAGPTAKIGCPMSPSFGDVGDHTGPSGEILEWRMRRRLWGSRQLLDRSVHAAC